MGQGDDETALDLQQQVVASSHRHIRGHPTSQSHERENKEAQHEEVCWKVCGLDSKQGAQEILEKHALAQFSVQRVIRIMKEASKKELAISYHQLGPIKWVSLR